MANQKYRSGAWEALGEPTLELVEWLAERGGLADSIQNQWRQAIDTFRTTRHLLLPQGIMSFTAQSELGRILPANPRDLGVKWGEIEEKLHAYIDAHRTHAAAWDALRIVLVKLHRFAEALHAAEQAIRIAPEDGELQFEVAMLYLAAVTNAVRESRGTKGGDPELQGCTVGALGCSYAMARHASRKSFESVLSSYASENYKKVAREAIARMPES